MKKPRVRKVSSNNAEADLLLARKPTSEADEATKQQFHVLGNRMLCTTDYRAKKRSPLDLVLEATDGFIPLWVEGSVLLWKFNEPSLAGFARPQDIKQKVRSLMTQALSKWGDAAPVRFSENADNSDFEIVIEQNESCTAQGCTLAAAFFPDSGRHQLFIFPTMFQQSAKEQVDTMIHEIGHIFGLRHFFAPKLETRWPSEIFGKHEPFSIMNYGAQSELTEADKSDLKLLYASAWNGTLKQINGTPIQLVRPYHTLHR